MKKTAAYTCAALLTVAVLAVPVTVSTAATQSAVSVTADKLQYDGKTQIATAQGNVIITRDQATMTGATALYNLKTAEADLDGGVTVEQPDMHVTAQKLHSTNKNYVVATGDARGIYGDKKLNGDQVEYYLDEDHGIVSGNGYMEAQGSQMWADHIDAWTKKISAVGTGNVHIESPKDNLTAYAERAEYMQTPGVNDGIINLFDNVYATQNGSSLNGDNLQIRLADNSAQAMSRSTLIIMPQNN